ncbi:UNVERIFIED_CONTAM: hypothetical protein FKN15_035323 [Acipenser sinensis]
MQPMSIQSMQQSLRPSPEGISDQGVLHTGHHGADSRMVLARRCTDNLNQTFTSLPYCRVPIQLAFPLAQLRLYLTFNKRND